MKKKQYLIWFTLLVLTAVYAAASFLRRHSASETLTQQMVFAARAAAQVLEQDKNFTASGLASSQSLKKLAVAQEIFAGGNPARRLTVIRDFNVVYSPEGAANAPMSREDYSLKQLYDLQVKVKRYFYSNERILKYKPDFVTDYKKKPYPEVDVQLQDVRQRMVYPLSSGGRFLGVAVLEAELPAAELPVSFTLGFLLAAIVILIFEFLVFRDVAVEFNPADWRHVLRISAGLTLISTVFLLVSADRLTLQAMATLQLDAQAYFQRGLISEWWQISFNNHNLPLEVMTASGAIAGNYSDRFFIKMAGFIALLATLLFLFQVAGLRLFLSGRAQALLKEHRLAYAYIAPAIIATILVIFIPFTYSVGLSFFRNLYNDYYFAGLYNFFKILFDFSWQPRAFYYTLSVTVLWTALNIVLHVSIGLGLALLLKEPSLKFKGVYRSLLILPWAVPNYITALVWKGMFHKEFGVINQTLVTLGFEPVSWFSSFWTALFANLATNTWLGFPFMMVIALGALQSIPKDLYEAADIDGASRWQKFYNITIPLLKPAMFPAIILGTIWTFNMFNIIYLVSNGAPNNSTDILVVEAYRAAFEKDLYAYASAYSMIIFFILAGYSFLTNRLSKASEGVY